MNTSYLDVLQDIISSDDKDQYFWNPFGGYGFHVHRTSNNELFAMKRTEKMIKPIPFHNFVDCLKKGDAIFNCDADRYFDFLPW